MGIVNFPPAYSSLSLHCPYSIHSRSDITRIPPLPPKIPLLSFSPQNPPPPSPSRHTNLNLNLNPLPTSPQILKTNNTVQRTSEVDKR